MKNIKKILLCFFLLLGISLPGVSQDVLENYLIGAAENNAELKAYFNEYMAAMERVSQVGVLPDPQVSFGYFIRPMEFVMGRQRAEISLMQMFPWFGTSRTQKDEASQMAMMKYHAFREAKNKLYFEVKSTWYSLHALEKEVNVVEKNIELMKGMERIALMRYQQGGVGAGGASGSAAGRNMELKEMTTEAGNSGAGRSDSGMGAMSGSASGKSSVAGSGSRMGSSAMNSRGTGMVDVLQIQMEIAAMENNLESLKEVRKPLLKRFNQLLSRDLNEPVQVPENITPLEITPAQMADLDTVILKNPMLSMLENEKQAYHYREKMARQEGKPMIGAGLNYMVFSPQTRTVGHGASETTTLMGGDNMIMPMISMTLPIYRKKYKAMEKEAAYLQESAVKKWENTASKIMVDLETARKNYNDAVRKVDLYKRQTELAAHALSIVTTAYTNEEAVFEDVLRVQQQLLGFELNYINALLQQNNAVAMIEMIASTEL